MSREVMQQALSFIEKCDTGSSPWKAKERDELVQSLREALAELAKPAELLDETSLRAVIGGIGNEVHNLACDHNRDEKLSNRFSEIAVNLWDVAKRASAEPVAVPDEWQLMPKQATEEMFSAWEDAYSEKTYCNLEWSNAYDALLKASPQPPFPVVSMEAVRDLVEILVAIKSTGYLTPTFNSSWYHRDLCKQANEIIDKWEAKT